MSQTATAPANAEKRYTVSRADLPLSCPLPSMALWNSHPRVYLPIEDAPVARCSAPTAVRTSSWPTDRRMRSRRIGSRPCAG